MLLFGRYISRHTPKEPYCLPTGPLTFANRFHYVRKRELDLIENKYGTTNYQKMLMFSAQAKYIFKEGWGAFKKDLLYFKKLRNKESKATEPITDEELIFKKRIRR
jgi:hypothetical protein